jgi:hypothetical protein
MAIPMIALDVNSTTREVFGNIAPWMRVVFFGMIAASLAVLGWQVLNHVRQWRKGRRVDLRKVGGSGWNDYGLRWRRSA